MHARSFLAAITLVLLASTADASAQGPAYTLQANARIVLTDVTVTGRDGKPVLGLKNSDFQVFDDKTPQTLSSFEEHTTQPVSLISSPAAPGVYSNKFVQQLPPFLNIMVIDIKNIPIEDQLYLNYKLTQLINTLPADKPLAIYWCRGPNAILLQSFTSDHALLLAAVHKAIPRFPPTGREFFYDFTTLQQIAVDLGQLPGRKNVLWFTGGSAAFLRAAPEFSTPHPDDAKEREVYDQLEASRIAIYPIDTRGLTVDRTSPDDTSVWGQHGQMKEIAEATGGHAFYSGNGFDAIATHLLNTDGSFYTLTYSPQNFRVDHKWHKIQVKLTGSVGPYELSYRRGYFADSNGSADRTGNKQPNGQPGRLLVGGTLPAEGSDPRSVPIIFQLKVQPAAGPPNAQSAPDVVVPFDSAKQKRGTVAYTLRYSLPLDAFTIQTADDKPKAEVGIAVIAFNQSGSIAAHTADQVTLSIRKDKLSLTSKALVSIEQRIGLPEGDVSLYCAVWDMASKRLGTIRVPIEVTKRTVARGPMTAPDPKPEN